MNKEGILIVVSGFSGAGKGTIMKALLERYDNYALSISATTRNPRPGEEEGKAYFFKTTEEFEKMIAKDDLIEYARGKLLRNTESICGRATSCRERCNPGD